MNDVLSLLSAKERGAEKSDLPAAFMGRLIDGESPLRVWREFRGKTLDRLSKAAGVSKPYISEVESGKKPGFVAFFRKCAKALDVDLDDLTGD
ncbi:MAG: helix-turn-helix transcriptional regulator [Alphaproteobacteria bacterium]|nr:helix-turn-helix transcriptional regulator [Alphaproteobacteria bacterium]